MKNKLLSAAAVFLAASSLFSCASVRNVPDPIPGEKIHLNENPKIAAGDYSSFEKFCAEFSKEVASSEDPDRNTLFSPLSAYLAMAMIGEGADGITLEEFKAVFGEINEEDVFELISHLATLDNTTLDIANSAWVDNYFTPKKEFVDTLSKYYLAETYKTELENAEKAVNAWIEEKTNGLIKDMLTDDAFSADTVMALVNAIYMNATWRDEFDATLTRKREFTAANGKKSEVDFMHNGTENELIIENGDFIGVTLPYSDGSLNFMAVMAKDENVTTDELIEKISETGGFSKVGESATSRRTSLFIPTFKLEYATSLNDVFISMGLGSAFESRADFSGIAEGIMIGNVLQNAVLRLDEKGTEAAAATVIEVKTTGADFFTEPPLVLEFNRPFVFAVYDKDSGAVLFCGEFNEA